MFLKLRMGWKDGATHNTSAGYGQVRRKRERARGVAVRAVEATSPSVREKARVGQGVRSLTVGAPASKVAAGPPKWSTGCG